MVQQLKLELGFTRCLCCVHTKLTARPEAFHCFAPHPTEQDGCCAGKPDSTGHLGSRVLFLRYHLVSGGPWHVLEAWVQFDILKDYCHPCSHHLAVPRSPPSLSYRTVVLTSFLLTSSLLL